MSANPHPINHVYLPPSMLSDYELVSYSVNAILTCTISFIELDPIIKRNLLERVFFTVLESHLNDFTPRKISTLACALSSVNWQDQQKVSSVLNSLGNQFLEQKGPLDTPMGNALLLLIKTFVRVLKDIPDELLSTITLWENRLPKPAVQQNKDENLDDDWIVTGDDSDDDGIPMTETFLPPTVPAVQAGFNPPPIPRSLSPKEPEKSGKPAIKKRLKNF